MIEQEQRQNEYRELIDRIRKFEEPLSFSSFSQFAKSPRHFIRYKFRDNPPSSAMILGVALDTLLTEPDEFDNRFAVAPLVDRRTKDGKEVWAQFVAQSEGKEVLTASNYDLIQQQKDALLKNPSSRFVLETATETQVNCNWEYKGFKWRGKRDFEGKNKVVDLKRCADAHPRKLRFSIRDMRYHWQSAMYTDFSGATEKDYFIVSVDAKLNVSVIEIDRGTRQQAQEEIEWYMNQFKLCIFSDSWNCSYDFFARDAGIYKYSEL